MIDELLTRMEPFTIVCNGINCSQRCWQLDFFGKRCKVDKQFLTWDGTAFLRTSDCLKTKKPVPTLFD